MKKKSNIVKMIELMVQAGAVFTPEEIDTRKQAHVTEGSDEISDEFFGLWEQVDRPDMYEHLCYGIYLPQDTVNSPHV